MRRFHLALLALVLFVAQPLLAKVYYVGTCKPGAYGTISQAVASVPAGSIVDVCAGTYAEQVVISQPLTLQSIAAGGASQVVIAMPGSGLATTPSIIFGSVAAQVEVTAGPVNLTGITVDGTASISNCPSVQDIGIYYASGSSGTLNQVETRYQQCNSAGIGIYAENGSASATSVIIENSNISFSSWSGIYVCGITPTTLNATIRSNYIIEDLGFGIATDCNTTATISSNVVYNNQSMNSGIILIMGSATVTTNTVVGGISGIRPSAAGVKVSSNTITGASFGITVDGAAIVSSNHISNSYFGMSVAVPGATIENNFITQGQYGIDFQCVSATVTGNTIDGPATGFYEFSGTSTGTNRFYNVATVTSGCS